MLDKDLDDSEGGYFLRNVEMGGDRKDNYGYEIIVL